MTKYINIETQEVSTDRAIIDSIKRTTSIGPNTLAERGWVPVLPSPKPTPSTSLKVVVSNGVVQDAKGNWVDGYTEVDMFSDDDESTRAEKEAVYLAKIEADKAAAEKEASKLTGIEILGVMCSATKEDQNGMLAIGFDKLTNTMAGTKMGSTVMKFENGSELVVTDENFNAVDALWRPFRKSFFTP